MMRRAVIPTLAALTVTVGLASPQDLSTLLPPPAVVSAPQFTCRELLSSSISSENTKPASVKAQARRGGEIFYMRLVGETLNLMTKAEASIGEAAGHPMIVSSSNADAIFAFALDPAGSSMSFLLQRKTGYAVWTQARATTWLGANAPDVQVVYFACKST